MKKILVMVFMVTTLFLVLPSYGNRSRSAPVIPRPNLSFQPVPGGMLDHVPLYFIRNQGQVQGPALYYARTQRYTLWLTKAGLVFDQKILVKKESSGTTHPKPGSHRETSQLLFLHTCENPEISAEKPSIYKENYLTSQDPRQWRIHVPASEVVCYRELYPNIDLKIYGVERQIEYDWRVKAKGNPRQIEFRYNNCQKTMIDREGNLAIFTSAGQWRHQKPAGYQMIRGKKIPVSVRFEPRGKNASIYGFRVGRYDKRHELIIDPMIIAVATYLGGDQNDSSYGMAVDQTGAVYIVGNTSSANFPLNNAFQQNLGGMNDLFISKILADGAGLAFSTFLGGNSLETATGIAVDSAGAIYATGTTASTNFPVFNARQPTPGGMQDGFISKLSADGASLIYSTYLGGIDDDFIYDIALNQNDELYVTGSTRSPQFPICNALQPTYAGGEDGYAGDAFLSKLTPGGQLIYSTFLGGSQNDCAYGLAVDSQGNAILGGHTFSTDFPTINALQPAIANPLSYDGFVAKVSSDGSALYFSSYWGGSAEDDIYGLAVDSTGIYVAGTTFSQNFPTTANAFQRIKQGDPYYHESDSFISKLSLTGDQLIYSTFLGAPGGATRTTRMAVTSTGSAVVSGYTYSENFPQIDSTCSYFFPAYCAAFVSRLIPDGSALDFSSLLISNQYTLSTAVKVNSSDDIYLAGVAGPSFPTYHPCQPGFAGGDQDAFVAKYVTSPVKSIQVTSPNGGEIWPKGSQQTISWNAPSVVQNCMITCSPDNGENWTLIAGSVPNTGQFDWTIPDSVSSNCLIAVLDGEPGSIIEGDRSDTVFIISDPPTFTVTSPAGNEDLLAKTVYPITWSSTGDISSVKIEYSTDGGGSWILIMDDVPNSGNYAWNIPVVSSANCLVRVTDHAGPTSDTCDAPFKLSSVVYCKSSGNRQNRGTISRVQVTTLSNSSGASSYKDFTALSASLTRGASAAFSLTPAFSGNTYYAYWKIWVDVNRDGDFTDTGETVYSGYSRSAISGSFIVPAAAAKGTARMRISLRQGGYPPSCGTFPYGEVEDYTVIIR